MQKFNFTKISIMVSLFAALSFFLPLFAGAIEYGGFGGRPAYPRASNPRTQSVFIHTIKPGETRPEGVVVMNNTSVRKTMMVYAVDSAPSTDGAFACKQLAQVKTDVGAWIVLAKEEVTLASGGSEMIPFTINVPANAGVGEHNGCIIIQEKKEKVAGQSGAGLSVRTGLRVAVTVPGNIIRKLEIVGLTITKSLKGFVLHPLVKNTGNVSIDADLKVSTHYFFGLPHDTKGGQYPILRGETSEWNFDVPKPFWGGWYHAVLSVQYDQNGAAGVGVKSGADLVKLPEAGIGIFLNRLTDSSLWFFSFPTPLALAIEILIVLLIFSGGFLFGSKVRAKKLKRAK